MDYLLLGSIHSQGIQCVSTSLCKNGDVRIAIDLPTDFSAVDVLGISWNYDTKTRDWLLKLPEIKKQFPHLKIWLGGYSATYDYEYLSQLPHIDKVFKGYVDSIEDYDYEHNIFNPIDEYNSNEHLLLETSRSCYRALHNRCSYCAQFQTPYKLLDIKKICNVLEKKITTATKSLILSDPNPPPEYLNVLYERFQLPFFACLESKDAYNIKSKYCVYVIGVDDIDKTNHYNHKKNTSLKMMKDISRLAENNYVMLFIVYDTLEQVDIDYLHTFIDFNPTVGFCANNFIRFAGVDNQSNLPDVYTTMPLENTNKYTMGYGKEVLKKVMGYSSYYQKYRTVSAFTPILPG
jgi:hypothetical protein